MDKMIKELRTSLNKALDVAEESLEKVKQDHPPVGKILEGISELFEDLSKDEKDNEILTCDYGMSNESCTGCVHSMMYTEHDLGLVVGSTKIVPWCNYLNREIIFTSNTKDSGK